MYRYSETIRILRETQIETRIIHKHHNIRTELTYSLLSILKIAKHLRQMRHHINKAHIGHTFIMNQRNTSCRKGHIVATEKLYDSLPVNIAQFSDYLRGMDIAARLSG